MSGHKNSGKHNNPKGKGPERRLVDLLKDFAKDWEGRQKELVTKHNEMAAQLSAQEQLIKSVANFAAGEFGKMQAKLNVWFSSVDSALHHHDVNDIAMSEILKEIFGQLTQMDVFFKRLEMGIARSANLLNVNLLELSQAEVEGIKNEATEWFGSVMKSAFTTANENVQRELEEVAARRKAEQEAKAAEMQKATDDKTEAEKMEAELRTADQQDRGLAPVTSGATEQENLGLPPEVRVFGMT